MANNISMSDYQKLNDGVGWLNFPKALVLALFAIVDILTDIRDELRRLNG